MEPPNAFATKPGRKNEKTKISSFKIINSEEKSQYYLVDIFLENDSL